MVSQQAVTQAEFAQDVGISQQAVSELVRAGVLVEGAGEAEWLLAYCARLREQAAGRMSSGSLDLAQERAALAREQRIRMERINAIERREYAPVTALTDVLARASAAIVSMLDHLDARIAETAPDLPEAARLSILNTVAAARNEWVKTTSRLQIDDDVTTDDDAAESADLFEDTPA